MFSFYKGNQAKLVKEINFALNNYSFFLLDLIFIDTLIIRNVEAYQNKSENAVKKDNCPLHSVQNPASFTLGHSPGYRQAMGRCGCTIGRAISTREN